MNDNPIGTDVVLAVIQGMTSMSNATNAALIDALQHDADRYRILADAIRDYADTIDSRRLSNELHRLVNKVCHLDSEEAREIVCNGQPFDTNWSY